MAANSVADEWKLSEYLANTVIEKASGRSEVECVDNYPRDVYFIGNLRPDDPEGGPNVAVRELVSKLSPSAMGCDLAIAPDGESFALNTGVRWALYYRVFPTFEQQKKYQVRTTESPKEKEQDVVSKPRQMPLVSDSSDDDAGDASVDDVPVTPKKKRDFSDALAPRFKKIDCHASALVKCTIQNKAYSADSSALQAKIDEELKRAFAVYASDPERVRTKNERGEYVKVPTSVLADQQAYGAFVASLSTEVAPQWNIAIETELQQLTGGDATRFSIQLANSSPLARVNEKDNPNVEHFIFDVQIELSIEGGTVRPFQIDLAPKGFRYDRDLWGQGFNCNLIRLKDSNTFSTIHSPIYTQNRYSTRAVPEAKFTELAKAPIPILAVILTAMKEYENEWRKQRDEYCVDPAWLALHGEEFEKDFQKYKDEVARFEVGAKLIRENADVNYAFRLTNETFSRGTKTSWRLFQIVFLVTQISGMCALASPGVSDRGIVDIVYFPTGGGKTEAYLGVIVFHAFYDRLRGKQGGVTAWTRFPLRLLTLQQTQRVADVIGLAELIRKQQMDKRLSGQGVDGFSVGYFVGQGGSPNEIADPSKMKYSNADMQVTWEKALDEQVRQQWKRVVKCPSCRTSSIVVDFDQESTRLLHRCLNDKCAFPGGVIPVMIVDNELYRYLPTVVVGTIDKLAGIGNQRKFSQLLGKVDGRCLKHGYYKSKCCQKDCSDPKLLNKTLPKGISSPTLFVQDELHLLKEGLGTFDAHYETFVQALMRDLGNDHTLKIIASSATIEAFDRQVAQLYGRRPKDARVFPGPGPTSASSFYAATQTYPQRLYVGIIPHNKTLFNAVLELIEYYHRAVYDVRSATSPVAGLGLSVAPGSQQWLDLVDNYVTSLTYFLATRDLNSLRTDVEGHLVPNLENDGLLVPAIHELTGSTTTDEVQRSLETLERPSRVGEQRSDLVLATSMVSHGVDIDRLNAMIFYGMPRQNAEYIQASSRVGRTHIGVIFDCFHPARERDQSHYSYFCKFHEFLGQLVEPVAINRWAKFSLSRTAPGLFMAVLLQKLANGEDKPDNYYMLDFVKKKITSGDINAGTFQDLLERSYLLDPGSSDKGFGNAMATDSFRTELNRLIPLFLDEIVSGGSQNSFVSEVLLPKPMRSLRDVDEPIEIELDSDGTNWSKRVAAKKD